MRKVLPVIVVALLMVTVLTVPAKAANSWAVGNLVGLCKGTEIRQGPGLSYTVHTIVPENNWTVKVIGGPVTANGQTWWDTSRFAAGDPSGGTGWVSQSQADTCPPDGGGGGGGGGGGDNGGGGGGGGGGFICPEWISPELPVFESSAAVSDGDYIVEWVADIGLEYCKSQVKFSFNLDHPALEIQAPNGSINFNEELDLTGIGYQIGKSSLQSTSGFLWKNTKYPGLPYFGYKQEQSTNVSEILSINSEHETRYIFQFKPPQYNFNFDYLRIPATVFMVGALAVAAVILIPGTVTYSAFAAVMILWFTQTTGVTPGTPLQPTVVPSWQQATHAETFRALELPASPVEPSQAAIDLFKQKYGDMAQWADFIGLAPERDTVSAYTGFNITGKGFTPNTEVYYEFGLPEQSPIFQNVAMADETGEILIPIEMPAPSQTPLGTYLLTVFDYATINQTMLQALDGNIDPNHFTVAVATVEVVEDVTPPTIAIASPEALNYNRCDQPVVQFDVTDDLSGVASVNAWVDQAAVSNGDTLDLLFWKLGDHMLAVQAFDKVGWEQNASTVFSLQATIKGTKCAMDRFQSLGLLNTKGVYASVNSHLDAADRALQGNKTNVAMKELASLLRVLEAQKKQIDPAAYNILVVDINTLINQPVR